MAGYKTLIAEDDKTLLDALRYNLSKEGYSIVAATEGVRAIGVARSEKPDLIILDIMLPKLDGFEFCRILRKEMMVPILMLTTKVEEVDKVVGLEIGADDYITKPFSLRQLLARVKAMLRRMEMMQLEASTEEAVPPALKAGDLEVDLASHRVSLGGPVVQTAAVLMFEALGPIALCAVIAGRYLVNT